MTDQIDYLQPEETAVAEDQPAGVIISEDTKKPNRVPPGQKRTRQWPVLDAAGTPPVDMSQWRLEMYGLVEREVRFDWVTFGQLPRVKVFADFHCVTGWSRLANVWSGVSTRLLAEKCGLKPEAKYVLAHGYDYGWTTNLPIEVFLAEDTLVATHHDGRPLTAEHGGPARLIVPRLFAWKSAKWLGGLEFLDRDRAGFWERNGYHMNGDPWKGERFGY
ncbi:MAG TPA: sulfite oxidase-like oxidoreductase [Bryobacteraceae bacterium]|nr:sulfite oxidase-like oxidoreductase [Bryobacteraceae bacterium]HPT26139.1 sulfite oxidase-like oxidoreductase [Bryobacteraceae bacterium]